MPAAITDRLAGGPISWGVCEVPGWGAELPPDRVLAEMCSLGLRATEAGPDGYLGREPDGLVALLERHDLRLIGGFLPVVLHERAAYTSSLAAADQTAALLAAAGATFLVSALVVDPDWSPPFPPSRDQWRHVFEGLARLDDLAAGYGLTQVLHPHWGTLVERRDAVARVLEGCDVLLCLDTGHLSLGEVDPLDFSKEADGRVAHVHLKDVDLSVARRLRAGELSIVQAVQQGLFRPLGEGGVAVADAVLALEHRGYGGWYVLEQDTALVSADVPEGEGPIEDVRRSIDFLRALTP